MRGVDRLARSGQREAIDRLVRALDANSPVYRDPRARIAGVRGLAPYVALESVRQVLARALVPDLDGSSLGEVVSGTAAMALAASDDERAIKISVDTLVAGEAGDPTAQSPSRAAEAALLAHPPRSLSPFGSAQRGLPLRRCAACSVGSGDLRALTGLRGTLALGLLRAGAAKDDVSEQTNEQASESRASPPPRTTAKRLDSPLTGARSPG